MKHYFAQYFCLLRCQCPPLAKGILRWGSERLPFSVCNYMDFYELSLKLILLVLWLICKFDGFLSLLAALPCGPASLLLFVTFVLNLTL